MASSPAISLMVLRSLMASSATLALNSGLCLLRMVSIGGVFQAPLESSSLVLTRHLVQFSGTIIVVDSFLWPATTWRSGCLFPRIPNGLELAPRFSLRGHRFQRPATTLPSGGCFC